ncbi:BLUF domain-containing protein [Stenotrophomonas sp. YAU14D1_LEIMI4_1]|uniref:BLUF domain-containing protein n=1 Tax=Stenotrophomonas sp. YAU14D1_LEIMI4_1 TaxID=2072407 RepID=UPI000D53EB37|nr:BLUF domain-containing protein [Stenotrophomonas sp. YAU14D1_LEIMI4_1]AWH25404.1 F420H(2):quinone oxidoreductase [Stenotrophomonas sp. YAU14D1_LEIMI4_1]
MVNRAIAYASEALPDLDPDRLAHLVEDAARFNRDAGITGVLLFDGQRFLQYIEGPEDALKIAYGRILASSSHREIIELARGPVGRRMFPYWSMRLLPTGDRELSQAAHADWRGFVKRAGREGSPWAAMDYLAAVAEPHLA